MPIVASEVGGFNGIVHSFDFQSTCIENTKMNSKIFGMADRVKTHEIDLIDFYFPKSNTFNENKLQFYKNIT